MTKKRDKGGGSERQKIMRESRIRGAWEARSEDSERKKKARVKECEDS